MLPLVCWFERQRATAACVALLLACLVLWWRVCRVAGHARAGLLTLACTPPQIPRELSQTPYTWVEAEEQLIEVAQKLAACREFAVDLEHHSVRCVLSFGRQLLRGDHCRSRCSYS